MTDLPHKKLQVFVSSTFEDLKPERQAAVSAILTAGHIPAGMELFTAGDESQMDVIKRWIDESDVYMLILGGRYGSVEPNSGKSYTHLEYEYALQIRMPFFACVVSEMAHELRVKEFGTAVTEKVKQLELTEFRKLVLSRMSKTWDDGKDIKIIVSETLAQFVKREDLRGWVRPTDQSNLPALSDELARLSKENADLRTQVIHQDRSFGGLTFDEMRELLEADDILAFLEERALALATPITHGGNSNGFDFLVMRGLVATSKDIYGNDTYFLSTLGQSFLNKLRVSRSGID
jgi:hypothetical protein